MRSFEAAEHGSPPSRCSHRLPHEDGALFGRPHSQRRPYARHHELSLPPNRPPSFCLSKNYASPEQHALRASAVCLHSPADSPRASPDARSDRAARTWTPPRPSEFHDASDRVIPSHALGDNLLPSHIPRSDDPRRLYLSPYETSSKLHHERRNGSRQLDDDAVVCTVLPAAVCLACLIIGVVLGYTLRTMTGGEGCALPPVHPKQTNCPLCPVCPSPDRTTNPPPTASHAVGVNECCACMPPPSPPPPPNPPNPPPPSRPPCTPPPPSPSPPSLPPPSSPLPVSPPQSPPHRPLLPPPLHPPPPAPSPPLPSCPPPVPMQPDPPARPPEQPPSPPTCDLGSRRDTRADLSEPHSCEELSASAFVCDAWYDSYSSFAHRVQLCERPQGANAPSTHSRDGVEEHCVSGVWLPCQPPSQLPSPRVPPSQPTLAPASPRSPHPSPIYSSPPLSPAPVHPSPTSPPFPPHQVSCAELLHRRDTRTLHMGATKCGELSRDAFVCSAWYSSARQESRHVRLCVINTVNTSWCASSEWLVCSPSPPPASPPPSDPPIVPSPPPDSPPPSSQKPRPELEPHLPSLAAAISAWCATLDQLPLPASEPLEPCRCPSLSPPPTALSPCPIPASLRLPPAAPEPLVLLPSWPRPIASTRSRPFTPILSRVESPSPLEASVIASSSAPPLPLATVPTPSSAEHGLPTPSPLPAHTHLPPSSPLELYAHRPTPLRSVPSSSASTVLSLDSGSPPPHEGLGRFTPQVHKDGRAFLSPGFHQPSSQPSAALSMSPPPSVHPAVPNTTSDTYTRTRSSHYWAPLVDLLHPFGWLP